MSVHTPFPGIRSEEMFVGAAALEEACEIARLGVWQWEAGTSNFSWSAGLFRIAGRLPSDFLPTFESTLECIHPCDRDVTRARLLQVLEDKKVYGWEFRIVRPDGQERHCWAKIKPLTDGARTIAVRGILLDVTERREAELALKASEEHVRYALELSPHIPWTADPEGNILEAGPRWPSLVGVTPQGWLSAVHPDDVAPTQSGWNEALRTGRPFDCKYRLRQLDGTFWWVRSRAGARRNEAGEIVRWYGLLEDISDQVATEVALRDSERWMRQAHEAAGVGIFEIDFVENVTKLSPQSLVLHGRPADSDGALPGTTWASLVHPEDGPVAWEAVAEAVRTGEPYDFTFRHVLPGGSFRWINGLGRVEYTASGSPLRMLGVNFDVTARHVAEDALAQSEALNRSIVETSPDSIKVIGADGEVVFVNGAGRWSMELEEDTPLLGREWLSCWPRRARERVAAAIELARTGGVGRFTAPRATARGTSKWWDVVVSRVESQSGASQRLVSVARDITDQKAAEERISWSADHDPLTRLPNRRLFETRLAEAIDECEISQQLFGVLILDLDDLKVVNDTLGHDAGDSILRELADRLLAWVPAANTVARLGGDEFAVIIRQLDNEEQLRSTARILLDCLRKPFAVAGATLDCRTSIGASMYPIHGMSPSELMKHADIALYEVKDGTRGEVRVFEPEMRAALQQRVSMINIARDALQDQRLVAFYQPKVDLRTGSVAGFEALVRLVDSSGVIHPPATFAAALEDYDTSTAITDAMISHVISDMRGWLSDGVHFTHVALNASAADFGRPGFARMLLDKLREAGIATSRLQLEVTETVFLGRGADTAAHMLNTLSSAGVTIAFDDFGTGYASLTHLKQFPVDVIKIDRSFVSNIANSQTDAAIAESVINLARKLGIEVVAEGVEAETQATQLRAMGCRYAQGFLYSPAISAGDVAGLVHLDHSFWTPPE